jgi:very-short-patch-repair endonuclease
MRGRARELRRTLTVSEQRLWNWLRNRTLDGCKFRRQVPVGPYVLDFYSPALKLAIEVDGQQHGTLWMSDYDSARTTYLRARNIDVVRIDNALLARDSWMVEDIIRDAIAQRR